VNKKILGFALASVFLAVLATPLVSTVMAKEKVHAELISTGQDPLIPGKVWDTNGGIQQQRGNTRTFYHILTIGDDSYPLVSVNTINARIDSSGYFVGHYDAIWYIPTEGSDSGFKGMCLGKLYDFDTSGATFPPFSRAEIKCTMQGFGDFEGQTLKFSFDGDFFAYIGTWTGYCIK
jgi:hypothetical protein